MVRPPPLCGSRDADVVRTRIRVELTTQMGSSTKTVDPTGSRTATSENCAETGRLPQIISRGGLALSVRGRTLDLLPHQPATLPTLPSVTSQDQQTSGGAEVWSSRPGHCSDCWAGKWCPTSIFTVFHNQLESTRGRVLSGTWGDAEEEAVPGVVSQLLGERVI